MSRKRSSQDTAIPVKFTLHQDAKDTSTLRKDIRSFSFQLYETTNDYQNLSFSPQSNKSLRHDLNGGDDGTEQAGEEEEVVLVTDRKEKRLQRNRESARLSRRRRKQYLEVLEGRVNYLCEEMDRGRREHVLGAISHIEKLRNGLLQELDYLHQAVMVDGEGKQSEDDVCRMVDGKIQQLVYDGALSRSSTELVLAMTFGTQYLRSLVIPPHKKFLMWLTLQNELYFRGGRAASERLSAARIGEKVSGCGSDVANVCMVGTGF
jgi:hypothetical protein